MGSNQEQAFSLVELLVSLSLVGILSAIAIPNYADIKTVAYNMAAKSDYQNFKTALYAHSSDGEGDYWFFNYRWLGGDQVRYTGRYTVRNRRGQLRNRRESSTFSTNDPFPGPLSHLKLSKGSLPRRVQVVQSNTASIVRLWMDHEQSSKSYRIYDISRNNQQRRYTGDQVITKRRR